MTSWECFCDEDQRGCLEFPSRMLSSWPSEGQLEELAAGCRALSSLEPSPDVVWLQREVLVSKALQAGAECPDYVRSFLEGSGTFPFGLTWEEAFAIPWLEIAVPLRTGSEEDPGLAMFLLGLMPEAAEKSPEPSFCAMARDSCKAAMNALSFAEKKTGRKFALLARHASSEFEGGSLALPLWLAAVALAEGLDPSPVLATGALDKDGRLLPVKGIEQKAGLCKLVGAKRFVYPSGSSEQVRSGGFPIHKKEDALFLLKETDESFWRMVCEFSRSSDDFWDRLPSLTVWKNDKEKRSWVPHAIRYAYECDCLALPVDRRIMELGKACDFMEKFKDALKKECEKMLKLFPLEWADRQEKSTDLFRLCQLHITSLNHKGDFRSAASWKELAEKCRLAVQESGGQASSLFLASYTRQCGTYQNRFYFEVPDELLKKMEEEWARFPYREQAVGKAYGVLCAGKAFQRKAGEALAFAKMSEEKFALEVDKVRRYLDRAYIYWDMDEDHMQEACEWADRYIGFTNENNVTGNLAFASLLNARKQAEGRSRAKNRTDWLDKSWYDSGFSREVEVFLGEAEKNDHPWMLYFYNAAIALQDEPDLHRQCLERSLDLCKSDPEEYGDDPFGTLDVLGLLPLSLQAELDGYHEIAVRNADELLFRLRNSIMPGAGMEAMERGCFNGDHFEPLLSCSAEEALQKVREDPKRFFPFNYR